ncbi:MAG: transglutaminase domain-containing protein [Planctomycetaceae bacterium]|nr:transglutaminase domain-containing protein [Planctomycetaceae bacterium]
MKHFCRTLLLITAAVINITAAPISASAAEQDAWYVVEFDGKRVGYEHLRWGPAATDANLLRCDRRTQIQLSRFGTDLNISARLSTLQDTEGRLLEFELSRVDRSGVRLQRSGKYVQKERLFLVSETKTGSTETKRMAVGGDVWSPVMSLWMPARVGPQQRRVTHPVFFPESLGVSGIVTEYRTGNMLKLGGRRLPVQRLNFYPDGDPARLTTLSFDESGQVLQQEKRVFGGVLQIRKASADQALTASRESVDVDVQSLIPIDGNLGRTNVQRTVDLQLIVASGAIDDLPVTADQVARRISASELVLTLSLPDPDRLLPAGAGQAPAVFLQASRWMPLDDPALQKMAMLGAGATSDAGLICRRLERHVHRQLRRAPFETSLLTADEVARNLRGDCTEHAVLLAALLRIKGIPSRVASGLVPVARGYGFQGHTWVEARLGDSWVSFDSAAPMNLVRIKLADSSLDDSMTGGIGLFLPVLDLVGRTKIHVVRRSSLIQP